MSDWPNASSLAAVPLFPLPNVVLLPRAILPLHIFEERYKAMTADALEGERLIAMALLRAGWEKDYYHRPQIEPVVCVGKILSHERLPDGKYNFLLQGVLRATVVREVGDESYRQAELRPLELTNVPAQALMPYRERLFALLAEESLSLLPGAIHFRKMLAGDMATEDVADLLAFNFLDDVAFKQSLLADGDVLGRVGRIVQAVEALRPPGAPSGPAAPPRRRFPGEPSMN
jgi:Lon protease-like protein